MNNLPAKAIESIEKPWGRYEVFYRDDKIEIAKAFILPGGFCSRHIHHNKSNDFLVLSGQVRVLYQLPAFSQRYQKVLTSESSSLQVASGLMHWFEAAVECVLLETYRANLGCKLDPADIDRKTPGGRNGVKR